MSETTSKLARDNSKAEKALAVAKDVLSRLSSYRLKTSEYVTGTVVTEGITSETDLQSVVDVVQQNCTVCALGACFLSKIRLFNKVPANEILRPYSYGKRASINVGRRLIEKHLADVFSPIQLDMIESAFEMRVLDNWTMSKDEGDLIRGASAFGQKFGHDRKARTAAVMQNIIDNGGTFVVDPVSVAEYFQTCSNTGDERD
jgi:hypothetical protein